MCTRSFAVPDPYRVSPLTPSIPVLRVQKKNFHKTQIFEVKHGTRSHREQGLMDQPYVSRRQRRDAMRRDAMRCKY
jgi:hypothetical protein